MGMGRSFLKASALYFSAQADHVLPGPGDGGQQRYLGQGQGRPDGLDGLVQPGAGGFDQGVHVVKGQGTDGSAVRGQQAHGLPALAEIGHQFHKDTPCFSEVKTADRRPARRLARSGEQQLVVSLVAAADSRPDSGREPLNQT